MSLPTAQIRTKRIPEREGPLWFLFLCLTSHLLVNYVTFNGHDSVRPQVDGYDQAWVGSLGFPPLTASLFLGAFVIQISQLDLATSPVVPCFLPPSLDDTLRAFQERDDCPLLQRFSQSVPLKKAHQAMFSFWRDSAKWRNFCKIGKTLILFNLPNFETKPFNFSKSPDSVLSSSR